METQPWYEVTTSVGTLIAALAAVGAIVVGIFTIRQRTASDARSQWWSRVQWAIDLSFEDDRAQRTVAFDALLLMSRSALAGPGDLEFLHGLALDALARVRGQDGPFEVVDEPPATDRVAAHSRPDRLPVGRDEVAAARLTVSTDGALGRVTPTWITVLAGTSIR